MPNNSSCELTFELAKEKLLRWRKFSLIRANLQQALHVDKLLGELLLFYVDDSTASEDMDKRQYKPNIGLAKKSGQNNRLYKIIDILKITEN